MFINILGRRESNGFQGFGSRSPPSISNVVQNISQFLPSFDQLPGVQSIRNGLPNRRPDINGANFRLPNYTKFYTPASTQDLSQGEEVNLIESEPTAASVLPQSTKGSTLPTPRSRIKLIPIANYTSEKSLVSQSESKPHDKKNVDETKALFSINSFSTPILIGICGILAVAVVIFAFVCRRHLCAISKTMKKTKEKEELAKKSNPSQLSNTLTNDSRNSMVMQQWQGPAAFGNRYVPWEREQQLGITVTKSN